MAGQQEKGESPEIKVNLETGETPEELRVRVARQQSEAAQKRLAREKPPKTKEVDLTESLGEVLKAYDEKE